jgi:deoxyribodipyrimidine photo-lyase
MAVFLFHRDLRIKDNTALNMALQREQHIFPVFICDPAQIDRKRNDYFSNNACQFMCESLQEIPNLNIFAGDTVDVLDRLPKFSRLYQNKDLSKFALERDERIMRFCRSRKIEFVTDEDYSLFPKDFFVSGNKRKHPYLVFAPFYKLCLRCIADIRRPVYRTKKSVFLLAPNSDSIKILEQFYDFNPELAQRGGRKNAEKLLKRITVFKSYGNTRDFPGLPLGTTKASAHLKFGTMSIREMFWTCVDVLGKSHALVRELLFREFYFHIYAHDPALQRGVAVYPALDRGVRWSADVKIICAWKSGKTGFPLVDAGMREMNSTGWMHNRCRMIVANFLAKLCGIDWRIGMQYFYTRLVDCDAFSNSAGWQWCASVGADAQPAFRVFNPFIQSYKFDRKAIYMKRWIPEIQEIDPKDIHNWNDATVREKYPDVMYPAPCVHYATSAAAARKRYKT